MNTPTTLLQAARYFADLSVCESYMREIRTYVSVAPYHLFRYVAEQVFRFNYRKWTDGERFGLVLACIFNRRLTYRLLAGIDDAGFMGKI